MRVDGDRYDILNALYGSLTKPSYLGLFYDVTTLQTRPSAAARDRMRRQAAAPGLGMLTRERTHPWQVVLVSASIN
jgi:hypothetical protein